MPSKNRTKVFAYISRCLLSEGVLKEMRQDNGIETRGISGIGIYGSVDETSRVAESCETKDKLFVYGKTGGGRRERRET